MLNKINIPFEFISKSKLFYDASKNMLILFNQNQQNILHEYNIAKNIWTINSCDNYNNCENFENASSVFFINRIIKGKSKENSFIKNY